MSDYVLTLIGAESDGAAVADLVSACLSILAAHNASPGRVDWLAPGRACDVFFGGFEPEAIVTVIRRRIGQDLLSARVDLLAQPAALRRKRLVAADLESTLIQNEMLDELAELIGAKAMVADITRRAMNGEIDFTAALKERVALFAGLSEQELQRAAEKIRLMPGAAVFIATMRAHGAFVALVTGGFGCFVRRVERMLEFDAIFANDLVVVDGRLTGEVREPILTRDGKEMALRGLAAQQRLSLVSTLAVGDGANDVPMLKAAGLGVAFHPKPIVIQQIHNHIVHGDLTGLLFAQGFRAEEFARTAV